MAPRDEKQRWRRMALDARRAQTDCDALSRAAVHRVLESPAYRQADVAMWYLDIRSELKTRWAISELVCSGKTIVVPFCSEDRDGRPMLGLWRLSNMDELVAGTWSILEPARVRWNDPQHRVTPDAVDVVIAPGLGFTRAGARLGHGRGYYDRLLRKVRPDCVAIGLCYESQLFERLPTEPHDAPMDIVVTQRSEYQGVGRNETAS